MTREFSLDDDWASLIFARVFPDQAIERGNYRKEMPLGYVFVIEPHRNNALRKMAGGHKAEGETPQETACREWQGETGHHQLLERFTEVREARIFLERISSHWSFVFETDIPLSQIGMMHVYDKENEGEYPEYWTVDEFREIVRRNGFLHAHYNRLLRAGLI